MRPRRSTSARRDWRYFAAAAVAFGGPALRQASLETQHAFGAIGYAEEHEAPRHFRRAHLDTVALGGAAAARRDLAAHLLDDPQGTLPEYDLGEAGNAFRAEVRAWLQQHWSGERKAAFDRKDFHDREFDASFARDLGKTGWLGLGWPREFGGQARTPLEQIAFVEMMERAEAPRIGAAVQANALMMFGTPEQQQRYLPEILRGEAMHGMGYSEPEAGSDLASLRTRAVRDGDEWVITGQKIWTTTYWGQYMFLAARTDREAKPHAGISMFVVPMDSPGISVKPATTMYDGSFANIFYDEVRVPADALIGPLNGGWKVLTDALANERGTGRRRHRPQGRARLRAALPRHPRRRTGAARRRAGARPHRHPRRRDRGRAAADDPLRRARHQRHDAAGDGRDQQGVLRRADGALRRGRARDPRPARRAVPGRARGRCATAATSRACATR